MIAEEGDRLLSKSGQQELLGYVGFDLDFGEKDQDFIVRKTDGAMLPKSITASEGERMTWSTWRPVRPASPRQQVMGSTLATTLVRKGWDRALGNRSSERAENRKQRFKVQSPVLPLLGV